MFSLTIVHRGGPPRVESFEGSEISIGRVPGNDLVLPGANISKRHARIIHNPARDTYVVIDNRSTNGTTVNDERLESPREVKRGEEIKIGDFVLSIADADSESVPVSAFDSMTDEALAQLATSAPDVTIPGRPADPLPEPHGADDENTTAEVIPKAEARTEPEPEPEPRDDASRDDDDDTQAAATIPVPDELRRVADANATLVACLTRYVEIDEKHRLVSFGEPCTCGACLLCESKAALESA